MFDSGRALHERGMPEQWRGREKQGSLGFPRIGKLRAKIVTSRVLASSKSAPSFHFVLFNSVREILGMLPLLPDMRRLAPSGWWTPRGCSLVGFRISLSSLQQVGDGPFPRVQISERQGDFWWSFWRKGFLASL